MLLLLLVLWAAIEYVSEQHLIQAPAGKRRGCVAPPTHYSGTPLHLTYAQPV